MGRVFRAESGSSRRNRKLRQIASALRHASESSPGPQETWDLIAFMALSLRDIDATVQQAAEAWERRDYWVKADRYREKWSWVNKSARSLNEALADSSLERARAASLNLAQSMQQTKPYKSRNKRPWIGAHEAWKQVHADTPFASKPGPDHNGV